MEGDEIYRTKTHLRIRKVNMADEELKGDGAPKKKSKMMLIIIVVLVLLAGGGGAAYFILFMGGEPVAEATDISESDGDSAPREQSAEGKAIYVAMPRPFQFNAPGITRERIVQIDVQLMVRGQDNEELAKRHIPMIEGNLLQVFSTSNADDLVTDVGKTELRNKATAQVRQVMKSLERNPVVEQVLFTGFVIQ
ncbi:MAG: flagellar FliL protein [Alphaproteobacteria bacterium]|jgi:flagellar FliL protein